MVGIAVVGAGAWGKNHIRTLHKMGSLGGNIRAVTHLDVSRQDIETAINVIADIAARATAGK